jgi:hypothetical protein
MAELLFEMLLWMRGSDREGTLILWRVATIMFLLAAIVLGVIALVR